MNKTLYPTIAAAMGGWFAAELVLAMQHPERMWLRDPENDTGFDRWHIDPNFEPNGLTKFDGVSFEKHLTGLVSDVWEFCASDLPVDKPVYLCCIEVESDEVEPDDVETQTCLQGRVWFEVAPKQAKPPEGMVGYGMYLGPKQRKQR